MCDFYFLIIFMCDLCKVIRGPRGSRHLSIRPVRINTGAIDTSNYVGLIKTRSEICSLT